MNVKDDNVLFRKPEKCSKNSWTLFYTFFLPLGQPDPVRNCTIETLHNLNIKIQCISGTSGGLEQQFLLKVI